MHNTHTCIHTDKIIFVYVLIFTVWSIYALRKCLRRTHAHMPNSAHIYMCTCANVRLATVLILFALLHLCFQSSFSSPRQEKRLSPKHRISPGMYLLRIYTALLRAYPSDFVDNPPMESSVFTPVQRPLFLCGHKSLFVCLARNLFFLFVSDLRRFFCFLRGILVFIEICICIQMLTWHAQHGCCIDTYTHHTNKTQMYKKKYMHTYIHS